MDCYAVLSRLRLPFLSETPRPPRSYTYDQRTLKPKDLMAAGRRPPTRDWESSGTVARLYTKDIPGAKPFSFQVRAAREQRVSS